MANGISPPKKNTGYVSAASRMNPPPKAPTYNEYTKASPVMSSGGFYYGTAPTFVGAGQAGRKRDSQQLAFQQQLEDYYAQQEAEYQETFGYPSQYSDTFRQAGGAAEMSYEQAMREIEAGLQSMRDDPMSAALSDYYMAMSRGEHDPFDERTLAALSSGQAAPLYAGATNAMDQMRESFAARGLGRSGGLASMEAALMQQAIQQATMGESQLRAQGAMENAAFRSSGMQAMGGYQGGQDALRQSYIKMLTDARLQKEFDPGYIQAGGSYSTPATNSTKYIVPPPIDQRRVGESAPQYGLLGSGLNAGQLGG